MVEKVTTPSARCFSNHLVFLLNVDVALQSIALHFFFLPLNPSGGYAAHSLAIMTDAAHLLTDFGSILLSIFSLWISSRPQSGAMTFGWHRAGEFIYFSVQFNSFWAHLLLTHHVNLLLFKFNVNETLGNWLYFHPVELWSSKLSTEEPL